jgi:hypothetical protein
VNAITALGFSFLLMGILLTLGDIATSLRKMSGREK